METTVSSEFPPTQIENEKSLNVNQEMQENSNEPKKKSKGHRCYFCGQRFMGKNILRKHISIHTDKDFFCEVCGKAFSANWCLKKHMKIHTGERAFVCEYCGKSFVQKCTMQYHVKAIHGSKAHPRCKSCGKRLKSFSNDQCWLCRYEGRDILNDGPESLHSAENSEVQLMEMNESQNLEISQVIETENPDSENQGNIIIQTIPVVYNVDVSSGSCMLTYQSTVEPKKENIEEELVYTSTPYICVHCDLNFTDSLSMQKHLLTHPNLKPFLCTKCGKDFDKSHNLKQHMFTHKSDRPFTCKICQSSFKSVPCLKQHLITHSQDRPYFCKDCGSQFKSMQGLKTHVMIHNKTKPLVCKVCNKRFTFLGNLQRHIRIHTGERPYKCRFCDKRFSQSNGLKAHEQTHQKPLKLVEEICPTCGKKFRSVSNYTKHVLICN